MREFRLMLLATYRDTTLTPSSPLASSPMWRFLGELAKERHVEQYRLRGLSEEDVSRLLRELSGDSLPLDLLEPIK